MLLVNDISCRSYSGAIDRINLSVMSANNLRCQYFEITAVVEM